MVLEHSFVSALPLEELMATAEDFLAAHGFVADPQSDNAAHHFQLRRGKQKAGRTRSILQLPQCVRLDWDRGRVTVALSITPGAYSTGSFVLSGASQISSNSKKLRQHTALMTAIANSLDLLLAAQLPPSEAEIEWLQVEDEIAAKAARASRRILVLICIIALIIVLPIAIGVILKFIQSTR